MSKLLPSKAIIKVLERKGFVFISQNQKRKLFAFLVFLFAKISRF